MRLFYVKTKSKIPYYFCTNMDGPGELSVRNGDYDPFKDVNCKKNC